MPVAKFSQEDPGVFCMRRDSARLVLGLTIAAAALLAACGPSPSVAPTAAPPTPAAVATATPVPQPTAVKAAQAPNIDQQFIDMMVPHHEGAVGMARIAEQRAERPELRQLAVDILRSQDAEISRMRQWRQE
jgi:uncharacterized protein (DUF305 family)